MLNFSSLYSELESLYSHAGRDPESFRRFAGALERAQVELRATFEEMTRDFAERTLARLRREGAEVTEEDVRLLRSWITGEATGGDLRNDDALLDRLGELQGALEELGDVRHEPLSLGSLDRVRQLLRRCARVTPDIVNTLERMDLVRRFDEALGETPTAPTDRAALADMLGERLHRNPRSEP